MTSRGDDNCLRVTRVRVPASAVELQGEVDDGIVKTTYYGGHPVNDWKHPTHSEGPRAVGLAIPSHHDQEVVHGLPE